MKKRIKAAGIFFTDGESVLLLKKIDKGRSAGTWSLPGGKSEKEESFLETAHRETKEETGLNQIPGKKIASVCNKDEYVKFTGFVYKVDELFDVILSSEHSDWRWFKLSELATLNLHSRFEDSVPDYLAIVLKSGLKFTEWYQIRQIIG